MYDPSSGSLLGHAGRELAMAALTELCCDAIARVHPVHLTNAETERTWCNA